MNCSTPGLPVHHQLPEFTQTHVHRVCDAIQPSHPLSSPSPSAPNPSQHQSLSNESTLRMRRPQYWSFRHMLFQADQTEGSAPCGTLVMVPSLEIRNSHPYFCEMAHTRHFRIRLGQVNNVIKPTWSWVLTAAKSPRAEKCDRDWKNLTPSHWWVVFSTFGLTSWVWLLATSFTRDGLIKLSLSPLKPKSPWAKNSLIQLRRPEHGLLWTDTWNNERWSWSTKMFWVVTMGK